MFSQSGVVMLVNRGLSGASSAYILACD